jgi:hypothetical protein
MAITLRYLIRLLVWWPAVVVGQIAPPADVSVQFTVFGRFRYAGLCYLTCAQAAPTQVTFFTQNKSANYSYRGPAQIGFFDAAELASVVASRPPKSCLPVPRAVALVSLPPDIKQALLVFIPLPSGRADGRRFRVFTLDDSQEVFPVGCVAVVNVSGRPFKGQFGHQILDIPVGRSANIVLSGPVELRLAFDDSGRWVAAGSHAFFVTPESRVYVVLFPPAVVSGVAPIIRVLVDTPQVEAVARNGSGQDAVAQGRR